MCKDSRWWLLLTVLVVGVSCGSDAPSKPDTGYGGNQPVPVTPDCGDECQRMADCVVHLCDEDKNTTAYTATQPTQCTPLAANVQVCNETPFEALDNNCLSACTDASLQSAVSPTAWDCFFQMTCREIFQDDACHMQASYGCN